MLKSIYCPKCGCETSLAEPVESLYPADELECVECGTVWRVQGFKEVDKHE